MLIEEIGEHPCPGMGEPAGSDAGADEVVGVGEDVDLTSAEDEACRAAFGRELHRADPREGGGLLCEDCVFPEGEPRTESGDIGVFLPSVPA